ncbi:DUF2637 domain-containing protein [Streptomyces sp. A1547]|uniref:DUF2637 domain-containing protein n=1 Tax=Streptomyces sp. A1547 TaxID=2563105 RepID=UPI00109E8496|nr:DUF2637 domain-containing protein [Streptomyces sp. A1547]THA40987.1 DUF2637 domain-containing protein [Streptomyces sp. A1547]
MTEETADRYALIAAGTVIIVLTGAGFWLSYAHLAEVAGRHGLDRSPIRQWAWPATLDMFIVAGELLMLRAGLRRVTDWWAVGLTAVGSLGSIALNVAGVNGTTAGPVPLLDYLVAAVPPTGAMLAFGVLMRQIQQRVARPVRASRTVPGPSGTAGPHDPTETRTEPNPDRTDTPTGPPRPGPKTGPDPDPSRTAGPHDPTETRTEPNPDRTDTPTGPPRPGPKTGPNRTRTGPVRPGTIRARVHTGRSDRRTGPRRLSEAEVVELVLPDVPAVLAAEGNVQITRAQLRGIMRARGIPLSNEHIGPVLTALRAATAATTSSEGATR